MVEQLVSVMLLTDSLSRENLADKVVQYVNEYPVGLVYLDIKGCGEIARQCGEKACQKLIESWKNLIMEAERSRAFGLFATRVFGDDALLLVRMEKGAGKADLLCLAQEIYIAFRGQLNQLAEWNEPIDFHLGTALFDSSDGKTMDHLVYNAVKEAVGQAKGQINFQYRKLQTEFRDILAARKITMDYQPIVSLSDGSIYGYEALARGPRTSYFATPDRLWEFAEKERLVYTLEKIARQQAIAGFLPSNPDWKLFINLNANVVHDPQFTPGQTLAFLEERGLKPQNIVFEITERQSIGDYVSFTKALDHYRKQGYQVAIDDAGAGYSSLQAIAELRPDYIKVDRSIIKEIDRDRIKAILLETLAGFAQKIGCNMIAEGIETLEELRIVHQLGIPFGQGYLLGRPHPSLQPVSDEAMQWWEHSNHHSGHNR
ncbi:EAL domain-containing protein [Anoxybacteroides tepidamans]|uniref:EAL domain-containing protein n=1 Tax=Anoxybacteroides tepidamans TaxID=265948 RepID=UPI000486F0A8|nr:EAL domain-containing protein [Anoxybacillus tepidamans]